MYQLKAIPRIIKPHCKPINTYRAVMSSSPQRSASIVGGHAQFAKGYVYETIGNITGAESWKESGKRNILQGSEEMKVCDPCSGLLIRDLTEF
jgi:uncharacterized protein YjbJ (UPF0337 family)